MKRKWTTRLLQITLLGLLATPTLNGAAQSGEPGATEEARPEDQRGESGAVAGSGQAKEVEQWAKSLAQGAEKILAKWVKSGEVSEDRLMSRLYYPMPDTDPMKYSTDYDSLADRDFPTIQEKILGKKEWIVYAVITDRNGYIPSHNRRYSKPLTNNRAVDLVGNRTKRIFGDKVGFNAARNEKSTLVQAYESDSGDSLVDLSVPIRLNGKHWGCARIGYRLIEK
jgi:methyl-accepting chemotaxis protein